MCFWSGETQIYWRISSFDTIKTGNFSFLRRAEFGFRQLNRTKAGNILYYIGFGICAAQNIRSIDYSSGIYTVYEFITLAVLLYMIVIRVKNNKGISVVGIVLFGICIVTELVMMTVDITNTEQLLMSYSPLLLLVNICSFCELAAFVLIWWNDSRAYIKKNKSFRPDLENDLIALKDLYESGGITEQEYNNRRKELLDKI